MSDLPQIGVPAPLYSRSPRTFRRTRGERDAYTPPGQGGCLAASSASASPGAGPPGPGTSPTYFVQLRC